MKHLLSRISNLCRAEWSYMLSLAGVVSVKHMPVFISVEPADYCQLSCPQCPVGMRGGKSLEVRGDRLEVRGERTLLSPDLFRRILSETAPFVWTVQFYFQGEPLLNRDLPEMIRLAHDEGLYTIVSTNAQSLTREMAQRLSDAGLSKLIVSMDGATQESYEQYRVGGKLQRVLDGLRYMREAGGKTTIELQCLRLRSNEHEWDVFRRHYREWGADRLTFKTAQFYDYEHGNDLMPSDERYSRYHRGSDNIYRLKHGFSGRCHRLWTGCVITAKGDVVPCCYDKAAAHSYGNILTDNLCNIFHSDKAKRIRRAIVHSADGLDICRNCGPAWA